MKNMHSPLRKQKHTYTTKHKSQTKIQQICLYQTNKKRTASGNCSHALFLYRLRVLMLLQLIIKINQMFCVFVRCGWIFQMKNNALE